MVMVKQSLTVSFNEGEATGEAGAGAGLVLPGSHPAWSREACGGGSERGGARQQDYDVASLESALDHGATKLVTVFLRCFFLSYCTSPKEPTDSDSDCGCVVSGSSREISRLF